MTVQDRIEGDAAWRPDDRAPPPPDGQDSNDERTMAMLAWALLLAGVVTFIAGVVAVIIAYARRGGAPDLWRGHYGAVIKMFWIWLLLLVIGTPLTLIVIGYAVLAVATIWTAVVGVRGLFRAAENKPA